MSDTQTPIWHRWAQFRFSVIGELLFSPPPKGQLQKNFVENQDVLQTSIRTCNMQEGML